MAFNANSLGTNIFVTALVLLMVFLLPWLDRHICGRLGLNLKGGVSKNPKAGPLMRLRQGLLLFIFMLYLCAIAYLVFFSRSAADEYRVHVALFEDLQSAVYVDYGILRFIRTLFTHGFKAAFSHVHILSPEDITQVYMNAMLFVPMGYLLPYVFNYFRARATLRPVICCFIVSLAIENAQLIAKRGFYDIDDLVANTLGGLIGQGLYLLLGYVVTHPDWRKELRSYRLWRKNARHRTLYPFVRRMGISRATLRASSEEEVWEFYVMKLGFRLKKQLVPQDKPGTDMLLEMGKSQIEIHCSNRHERLGGQTLTINARNLNKIIKRLNQNGIRTGGIEQDPYTERRMVRFKGPDGVNIAVIEN